MASLMLPQVEVSNGGSRPRIAGAVRVRGWTESVPDASADQYDGYVMGDR